MNSKLPIMFLLLVSSVGSLAAEFHLDEQILIRLAKERGTPAREKIEATYLAAKVKELSTSDRYRLNLVSGGDYLTSNETSLSSLLPTTEKSKNFNVGIERLTPYGMNVEMKYLSDQTSTTWVSNSSSSKLVASISMDLYKDFFGKLSRAELDSSAISVKEAALKRTIEEKGLVLDVRKIYWDYVAVQEAITVTQKLLKSAAWQIKDAKERKKSGIADTGDVERMLGQQADREAQLLQLKGNLASIARKIKALLPKLQGHTLVMKPYDINKTVDQYNRCLVKINSFKKAPLEYTLYDDIVALQNERFLQQKKITNSYNQMNVSLVAQAGISGKDYGISDANQKLIDDNEDYQSVGIQVSIPIDGKLSDTRAVQEKLDYARFYSESKQTEVNLQVMHETITKIIDVLQNAIVVRKKNLEHSERALRVSYKKYKQARISSQTLVQEGDQFFTNSLTLIDTQKSVITAMLDYFSLYTDTPCELNY